MQKDLDNKLITLIIPGHKSMEILKSLYDEKGITKANKANARGVSNVTDKVMEEMEVLNVTVEESRAQEIFMYLYEKAELYKPNTGVIFQQGLRYSTEYNLNRD